MKFPGCPEIFVCPKPPTDLLYPSQRGQVVAAFADRIEAMTAMPAPSRSGKADCFKTIQRPSMATLVPARNECVNFDTTENLIIEGDKTELTRSTIVRILKDSKRLPEFLVNPQKFMDAVAAILKQQLHKLMIDGIKYERVAGEEFSMMLFEEKEIVSYLNNRLEVKKSVYDAVVYDSELEREFAETLDKREDIKLFVKLPDWFKIETPLGTYNPDWAILKHDNTVLYLVRETKGTKNFEKLRNIEAEKIRCGRKHFETLNVDFDVVTSAKDV